MGAWVRHCTGFMVEPGIVCEKYKLLSGLSILYKRKIKLILIELNHFCVDYQPWCSNLDYSQLCYIERFSKLVSL